MNLEEQNLNEQQKPQLNIGAVSRSKTKRITNDELFSLWLLITDLWEYVNAQIEAGAEGTKEINKRKNKALRMIQKYRGTTK